MDTEGQCVSTKVKPNTNRLIACKRARIDRAYSSRIHVPKFYIDIGAMCLNDLMHTQAHTSSGHRRKSVLARATDGKSFWPPAVEQLTRA